METRKHKKKHSLRVEYFLMELILSDGTKCAEGKETHTSIQTRVREATIASESKVVWKELSCDHRQKQRISWNNTMENFSLTMKAFGFVLFICLIYNFFSLCVYFFGSLLVGMAL